MTYNQTLKEIDRLTALLNATNSIDVPYLGRKVVCEGHGMFHETNEVVLKYRTISAPALNANAREELQRTIDALEATIKDERERRAKVAKAKRYRKELEELNARKAYLEKWLEENEGA